MRTSRIFMGVALLAVAVTTFADDASAPTVIGTWSYDPQPGEDVASMTQAIIAPDPDGTHVQVDAEISVGGARTRFKATGTATRTTVEYKGILPNGLVARLSRSNAANTEVAGSLNLLEPNKLRGRWSLGSGESGYSLLTRLGTGWKETTIGEDDRGRPVPGTPEQEAKLFDELAQKVLARQAEVAEKAGAPKERGFHNKGHGVRAELRVSPEIAADLRVDIFQPGARLDAIARFSNAQASKLKDAPFDPRGLAFRVKTGHTHWLLSGIVGDARDFLVVNTPTTPPDPVRFVDVALAVDAPNPIAALMALAPKYGAAEIAAIISGLAKKKAIQTELLLTGKKTGISFTEEQWSSGAAIKWGPSLAVKVALVPASVPATSAPAADRRDDLEDRLAQGEIVFDVFVQRFKNERETPIENGGVAWNTPLEKVAQLAILKQDMDDESSKALAAEIEKTGFNPWNTVEEFRPLGAIMRARKVVYQASQEGRGAQRCPFGFGGQKN